MWVVENGGDYHRLQITTSNPGLRFFKGKNCEIAA